MTLLQKAQQEQAKQEQAKQEELNQTKKEEKKMAEEKKTDKKKKKPVRRDSSYLVFCEDKGFFKDGMEFTLKLEEAEVFDMRTKAESYINGLKRFFKNNKLEVIQILV